MSEYKAAVEKMVALQRKAAEGDAQARKDKVKAAQEVRSIEREAARAGTVLSATVDVSGKATVSQQNAPSKRSLQEEYCRKFDDKTPVNIDGKTTTLRKHHEARLLGR